MLASLGYTGAVNAGGVTTAPQWEAVLQLAPAEGQDGGQTPADAVGEAATVTSTARTTEATTSGMLGDFGAASAPAVDADFGGFGDAAAPAGASESGFGGFGEAPAAAALDDSLFGAAPSPAPPAAPASAPPAADDFDGFGGFGAPLSSAAAGDRKDVE